MTVRVIGPRDVVHQDEVVINTTSRSHTWSRGLSPFYVGPIPLYPGATPANALNMENAWQFAKVYSEDVGEDGNPIPRYFQWAADGWSDPHAHRYPKGRGRIPKYTWWDGQRLDYIAARKKVYFPLYARAVAKTEAFVQLQQFYKTYGRVTLWDFDGYDHIREGLTLKDVLNNPHRKMGHAFVLAWLLGTIQP